MPVSKRTISDKATSERDILDFTPPSLAQMERALKLQSVYFDPQFFGWENIDRDRPALYVGNHTIYGTLDAPLIYLALYREKGVIPRFLGDSFHWKVPVWGKLLTDSGAVEGNRKNCTRLMEAGEHVFVFPGGGREVAKRKGEEYKLTWKTRTGFAAMAIEHQYPIIPVASVGADDTFDVLFDTYDFQQSILGRLLMKSKAVREQLRDGDVFFPLCKGIGITPIPRPERFYVSFGKPIDTSEFAGQARNLEAQWQLRKRVADALESDIAQLREYRKEAALPSWRERLIKR
ncbi:putative acyltransferase [gamma proteobacterium HdN1]|nr:putative acyltransferase [gamma proteobacterium HdN1]